MITETKYNVLYEDNTGMWRTALLSHPPSEQVKREYKMTKILDIEPVEITVRDDREYVGCPSMYKLKP